MSLVLPIISGISLPLTEAVMDMMQSLKADGFGNDNHCAIAKYYEKTANITIEH